MPTPEEILNGLTLAANKFIWVSIDWHIVVIGALILLFSGKSVDTRYMSAGMAISLLSVAIIAMLVSNPFNAVMFALATLLFGFISLKLKRVPVGLKWDIISVAGWIMLVFGFIYPHFLHAEMLVNYLYSSPLGLIPCPTLSAFIGFTLIFHGFNSKKWMISAALLGLFYGIFGVLRLKVYLDIVLIAGALFLLIYALTLKKPEFQNN